MPFAGRTGQGDSLSRLPGLDAAAWNALDLGVQMAAVPPAGRRRESGHIVRLPGSFPRLRRSRRCRIRGASSSRSGTLPTFQSASRLQTARKDLRRPLVPRFNLPKCAPSGTSGSAPTFGWPPCLVLAAVPARHQRTGPDDPLYSPLCRRPGATVRGRSSAKNVRLSPREASLQVDLPWSFARS